MLSFLNSTYGIALTGKKPDPICLAKKCGMNMVQCGWEKECRDWLQCVVQCGDDKVKCPSFCGFFFQSAKINKTSMCIFDSNCVDLGFSSLPSYEHTERPLLNMEAVEGTYWFAASYGGKQIFDYDCQRFDFVPKVMRDEGVEVSFSVPLTHRSKQRLTSAQGVFKPLDSGAIEVIYENFAGYHEKWYIIDKTEATLFAHVCIGDDNVCYDYGAVLLSKKDVSQLSDAELVHLQGLTHEYYGVDFESFHRSKVLGCSNQQ